MLAWYSVIHVPDERVPEAFAEFCRVLAPGGLVLLAFQVGDEVVHVAEARGHPVALDYRWRRPEWVAELLGRPGWRFALNCCANPMTTATSRSRSRRPSSWPVNPRNEADVGGCGIASPGGSRAHTVPLKWPIFGISAGQEAE